MSIWSRISGWKGTLVIAGLVIVGVSMWYSNYLADKLSKGERDKVNLVVRAYKQLDSIDINDDVSFYLDIILGAEDIPLIVTDLQGNVEMGKAFGPDLNDDKVFLAAELIKMQKEGLTTLHCDCGPKV